MRKEEINKNQAKLEKEANRIYRLKYRLGMAEERITNLKY